MKNLRLLVKFFYKMEEKAKIFSITLLFLLITSTQAAQDVNFTVRNSKGLCFYTDDVDCQTCDNSTFILNGSIDHIIHLAAQKPLGNCGNYTKDLYTTNSTEIITEYMTVDFMWEMAIIGLLLAVFLRWVRGRRLG